MIGFYPLSNVTTLNETADAVASFLASNSATIATTLPNYLISTPSVTTPPYTFNASITAAPGEVISTELATSTYSPLLNAKHRNATRIPTLVASPTVVTLIITDTSGHTVTSVSRASDTVTLGVPPGWTASAARPARDGGLLVGALCALLSAVAWLLS